MISSPRDHRAHGPAGGTPDSRRLAEVLSRRCDALLLLTATPHDGNDRSFASLCELLDPSLVDGRGMLRGERLAAFAADPTQSVRARSEADGVLRIHRQRLSTLEARLALGAPDETALYGPEPRLGSVVEGQGPPPELGRTPESR